MTKPLKKDPAAEKTFFADWTRFLNGRTLVAATWVVPTGLVKMAEPHTDSISYVKVSGGTVGDTYTLECSVTISDGDKDRCSMDIYVEDR